MTFMRALSWQAPPGFVEFEVGWDHDGWVAHVIDQTGLTGAAAEHLAESLRGFAAWCAGQEDAAGALWIAGIASTPDDRPHVAVVGDIRVGEGADVEPLVEDFERDYAEADNLWHHVEFSPSHSTPALAASQIRLVHAEEGGGTYQEDAVALMGLPRLGLLVRMSISTLDLAAFDDTIEFLLESVRRVEVTTEEGSYVGVR